MFESNICTQPSPCLRAIDFAVTWRGKQTVKTVVAVAVAAAAL